MNEIAVVTASTGGYDHIRSSYVNQGVDYLYYTEVGGIAPSCEWRHLILPDTRHLDSRRQSKLPKLNPHALPELQGYRYVIWIDGDMEIRSPFFVEQILSNMKNGFVIGRHFDGRDCAYGEATIRPPKYAKEPLDQQVAYYRSMGFPERAGLYECGVNARDMKNPAVREVGLMWHQQNLLWSYQDQVSLPFVFWYLGFEPDILPISFRDMGWIHLNAHTRED